VLKKIRNLIVGWIGALAIRVIAPTVRWEAKDESGLVRNREAKDPVIFAFWHNRMFLMPYIYKKYFPGRHVACLVSASQDGEMIARVIGHFGLEAVRGSSSRRGKEAYRELAEKLKQGLDVAITPDGPRGPCYQSHDGVVSLAAFSQHHLIPVACRLSSKIQLKSWDRFMIPMPFSRCEVYFGKAILFPNGKEEEDLKEAKLKLENELSKMN
jgi:lysophospholipid acyltransferase (LPLAT)-like uncharacterized protein